MQIQQVGTKNLTNRDNWLERTLRSIPAGYKILDAGAGELKYKSYCQHLKYLSQDFAQYDGKGDQIGLQRGSWDQSKLDIISDIKEIPISDASFDAVMCIEVLEHVPYPVDAIRELIRLLRPGGDLIITAPFCSLTHFSPFFYQTGFSENFYKYWLSRMGMEILDLQFNGNYFEYLAQEIHRLPSIAQKYSAPKIRIWEWLAIKLILNTLKRFSAADRGSHQILSFGIHIHARRNLFSE